MSRIKNFAVTVGLAGIMGVSSIILPVSASEVSVENEIVSSYEDGNNYSSTEDSIVEDADNYSSTVNTESDSSEDLVGNNEVMDVTPSYNWRESSSSDDIVGSGRFTDVKNGAYYYDAVYWAVKNGITSGTSGNTFSPNATCTRAQAVMFLWRNEGSPVEGNSNFKDVSKSSYYAKAVNWAVKWGITSGTSKTTFSPNQPCTRAQIATFIYRYLNRGTQSAYAGHSFADSHVGNYWFAPVNFMYETGITRGIDKNHFGSNQSCTRAQIVTFLYRSRSLSDVIVQNIGVTAYDTPYTIRETNGDPVVCGVNFAYLVGGKSYTVGNPDLGDIGSFFVPAKTQVLVQVKSFGNVQKIQYVGYVYESGLTESFEGVYDKNGKLIKTLHTLPNGKVVVQ